MKKRSRKVILIAVLLIIFIFIIVMNNFNFPDNPGGGGNVNPGGNGDDDDNPGDSDNPVAGINTLLVTKFVANLSSPQEAGTKIRISVTSNGPITPNLYVLYQYFVNDGEGFVIMSEYSKMRYYDWTPTKACNYKIMVWAKLNISENEKDAERTIGFTVGSDAPALGGTYVIELDRWGIDGDPYNNSKGINEALIWASQSGYKKIQFPTQEYVISEYVPVNIQHMRNVTIDLNNATLRINANSLRSNQIVFLAELRNVKFINGTILGDIGTHDYTTFPGTTEGNLGILIERGVVDCQIDNVTVKDVTGWGIVISHGGDYSKQKHGLSRYNLESGSINLSTGERIPSTTTIRTINLIDVSEFDAYEDNFFILGYDLGYMNNIYMATRQYDVIFYDKDKNIIGSAAGSCYKKMYFPAGMAYVDFVVYQSNVPTNGEGDFNGAVAFITHHVQPTNLKITNSVIDNCRSLAIAICGGDNIIIQNNILKNTQYLAPGYAIDAEDGWELVNNVQILDNTFENNGNDIAICAGDNFVISRNNFSGTIIIYARTMNYKFTDNIVECEYKTSGATAMVRMGFRTDTIITGNKYINVGHGVTREKEGVILVWEDEELIDSSIMGMGVSDVLNKAGASIDIELKDSDIIKTCTTNRRLAGTYVNCYFDVDGAEMIGSTIKDSIIDRMNANLQYTCAFYNNTMKDMRVNTGSASNSERVIIKGCVMTDFSLSIATYGPIIASIDIQDCNITLTENLTRACFHIAGGKTKNLFLKNNVINNQSRHTTVDIYDVAYAGFLPNMDVTFEDNTFIQESGYIFSGKKLTGGSVRVLNKNTTIVGQAEMFNTIYTEDVRFVITTI